MALTKTLVSITTRTVAMLAHTLACAAAPDTGSAGDFSTGPLRRWLDDRAADHAERFVELFARNFVRGSGARRD